MYGQLEKIEDHYDRIQKDMKRQPVTLHYVQEDDQLVDDFDQLAQIILIRHGEPALYKKGRRNRREAMQYIRDYDSVGVYKPEFIPLSLAPGDLTVIHTSSMNRSISTAEQVFDQKDLMKPNALFREFERKIFSFPHMRLPLKSWLVGSRVLWYLGLNKKGIESLSEAKQRAHKGVLFLEEDGPLPVVPDGDVDGVLLDKEAAEDGRGKGEEKKENLPEKPAAFLSFGDAGAGGRLFGGWGWVFGWLFAHGPKSTRHSGPVHQNGTGDSQSRSRH